jgi:glutathionylspermidine synthase
MNVADLPHAACGRSQAGELAPCVPLRTAAPLAADAYAAVRRATIFGCGKWDPQFEDIAVLCDFPIVLCGEQWRRIAAWAEQLAAETLAAEQELAARPELHGRLGLPRAVRRALNQAATQPPCDGPRVMRFDFHFTTDGWRISEVNSDVPGGFIEGSGFAREIAAHYPSLELAGDPAAAYAVAWARRLEPNALIALVHATAYTDDRQVMLYLAEHLHAHGLRSWLASPADLRWDQGRATVDSAERPLPVDGMIRFFPAEWLPNLPRRCDWQAFFRGSRVPLSNPATALLTQTKRFPLVWADLQTPLPTWRTLLPETVAANEVHGAVHDGWVFKPALGRVGEDVAIAGVIRADHWRRIRRAARWHPGEWIAQRRFEVAPLDGPRGPVYPQVGVYTVDGRAAGIYGRLAARPLIDCWSQDVAVLVEESDRP